MGQKKNTKRPHSYVEYIEIMTNEKLFKIQPTQPRGRDTEDIPKDLDGGHMLASW